MSLFELPPPNVTSDPAARERLGQGYLALRQWLGRIGLALPIALVVFRIWDGGETELRTSISAYYYSAMRDVFVGALIAIGLFLITYRGNTWWEWLIATISGVGAIGVALLPTARQCKEADKTVFFAEHCGLYKHNGTETAQPDYFFWQDTADYQVSSGFFSVSTLHFASAAVFLLGVAALAYWAFVTTSDTGVSDPDEKTRRNVFYRRCAIIIVGCIAAIGFDSLMNWLEVWNSDPLKPVFWLECFAVWAFAAAWLQKGENESLNWAASKLKRKT